MSTLLHSTFIGKSLPKTIYLIWSTLYISFVGQRFFIPFERLSFIWPSDGQVLARSSRCGPDPGQTKPEFFQKNLGHTNTQQTFFFFRSIAQLVYVRKILSSDQHLLADCRDQRRSSKGYWFHSCIRQISVNFVSDNFNSLRVYGLDIFFGGQICRASNRRIN